MSNSAYHTRNKRKRSISLHNLESSFSVNIEIKHSVIKNQSRRKRQKVICPLSGEPIRELAMTANGSVYEYSKIREWFNSNIRDPATNFVLPTRFIYKLDNSYLEDSSKLETYKNNVITNNNISTQKVKNLLPDLSFEQILIKFNQLKSNAVNYDEYLKDRALEFFQGIDVCEFDIIYSNGRNSPNYSPAKTRFLATKSNFDLLKDSTNEQILLRSFNGVKIKAENITIVSNVCYKDSSFLFGSLNYLIFRNCNFNSCDFMGCDLCNTEFIDCGFFGSTNFNYAVTNIKTIFNNCRIEAIGEWGNAKARNKDEFTDIIKSRGLNTTCTIFSTLLNPED